MFQTNGARKQAGVHPVIFSKIDFKPKLVDIGKDQHFILIKEQSIKKILWFQTYMAQTEVHPTPRRKYY